MDHLEVLRTLYEERHLDEARAEYRRLRENGEDGAELHLLGALTAWRQGDLFAGRPTVERGLATDPTGALLGKLRFAYGLILREIGDTAAVDTLQAFIDGMPGYPELEPLMLGSGYYNLGLAYRVQFRLEDAAEAYRLAIEEFRREGLQDHHRKALQNLAWVYCLQGDTERAQDALDEAYPLCTTDQARWHQRLGMAFQLSVAGERVKAMEFCDELTRSPAAPLDVLSHAFWLAARTALDAGMIEGAEVLVRQALDVAIRAKGDNRCFADASELLRLIRLARITSGA